MVVHDDAPVQEPRPRGAACRDEKRPRLVVDGVSCDLIQMRVGIGDCDQRTAALTHDVHGVIIDCDAERP